MSTSEDTMAAVKRMELGLAANEDDMTKYFHDDFVWRGNQGCGTKLGLDATVSYPSVDLKLCRFVPPSPNAHTSPNNGWPTETGPPASAISKPPIPAPSWASRPPASG